MSSLPHTFRAIDTRIREIANLTLALGAMVQQQYNLLARGLVEREEHALEKIIHTDRRVDRAESEVDELVITCLLTLTPVASDLRRVLATTKVARELERAGDEARKAAKQLTKLSDADRYAELDEPLAQTACLVAQQIDTACLALTDLNADRARLVIQQDQVINMQVRALRAKILALPETRVALLYVILAQSLERGGDHAKVIAKMALWVITGKEARHQRSRTQGRPEDSETENEPSS